MLHRDMTHEHPALPDLTDKQLLAEVQRLVNCERHATAALIRSLAEFDTRRLFLAQGYSSLFAYCTQVLHLGEHATLSRIEVARAARRLPVIFDQLESGEVTLTNIRLLAPHLTSENHRDLLARAKHRSKRDVDEIIATLRPKPEVVELVRKLPAQQLPPGTATTAEVPTGANSDRAGQVREAAFVADPTGQPTETAAARPSRHEVIAPTARERYKVQFTVSREAHDLLRRAQDLSRHTNPTGELEPLFSKALALLVEHLERGKCAAASRPRTSSPIDPGSRRIPAHVRREVWERDQGRCAFVGARGRCAERGFLEFHHVEPYAAGGAADAANIQLRCRAHNAYEATLFFGGSVVREECALWERHV